PEPRDVRIEVTFYHAEQPPRKDGQLLARDGAPQRGARICGVDANPLQGWDSLVIEAATHQLKKTIQLVIIRGEPARSASSIDLLAPLLEEVSGLTLACETADVLPYHLEIDCKLSNSTEIEWRLMVEGVSRSRKHVVPNALLEGL